VPTGQRISPGAKEIVPKKLRLNGEMIASGTETLRIQPLERREAYQHGIYNKPLVGARVFDDIQA